MASDIHWQSKLLSNVSIKPNVSRSLHDCGSGPTRRQDKTNAPQAFSNKDFKVGFVFFYSVAWDEPGSSENPAPTNLGDNWVSPWDVDFS